MNMPTTTCVCAKCHHCTLWKIVPRLSQHEKPCMFWEVSKQDTCLDATSLVSGNISIYAYAHLRFTLLSTLEPVYKDGIPVPHSLSSITCCYRPTSHTLGVENCHLPSTMPVAVNMGLALPRSHAVITTSKLYCLGTTVWTTCPESSTRQRSGAPRVEPTPSEFDTQPLRYHANAITVPVKLISKSWWHAATCRIRWSR